MTVYMPDVCTRVYTANSAIIANLSACTPSRHLKVTSPPKGETLAKTERLVVLTDSRKTFLSRFLSDK